MEGAELKPFLDRLEVTSPADEEEQKEAEESEQPPPVGGDGGDDAPQAMET